MLLGQVPEASEAAVLNHLEVPVRFLEPITASRRGHPVGVICDSTVVVSSANWTEPGLSGNDEAALAVAHPEVADYFKASFDADWDLATSL